MENSTSIFTTHNIIQGSYGIPLAVTLFLALCFLQKHRKQFHQLQFFLLRIDLLNNIVCWANNWYFLRLNGFTWVESHIPLLKLTQFLILFFMVFQFSTSSAMLLNQLDRLREKPIVLTKRSATFYYVVALIVSCAPNIFIYLFPNTAFFVIAAIAIFQFLSYFIMGWIGKTLGAKIHAKNPHINNKRLLRKLKLYLVCTCIFHTPILLFCIMNWLSSDFHIGPDWFVEKKTILVTYASDWFTLLSPMFYFLANREITRALPWKKSANVIQVQPIDQTLATAQTIFVISS